jgi:hypothetical protein
LTPALLILDNVKESMESQINGKFSREKETLNGGPAAV